MRPAVLSRLSLAVRWLAVLLALTAGAGAQNVSEQYLLSAANEDRAGHGLPLLRVDNHLLLAARRHADEMARRGGISHQFDGEAELAERASAVGARFSLVTENVAEASNSALIHQLWMSSAGHRANLLDPMVNSVGIAVVQKDGQLYAVEDFARAVKPLTVEEQELAVRKLLVGKGVTLLPDARDARQTCTMSTGYAGQRRPWYVMRYTSGDLGRLPEELLERLATGRYHEAAAGACVIGEESSFAGYSVAVMLYP